MRDTQGREGHTAIQENIMHSIHAKTRIGADGRLQIQVPAEFQDADVEVVVVLQPTHLPQEASKRPQSHLEKRDIQRAIEGFRQLRRQISPSHLSVREMIEEGRRF